MRRTSALLLAVAASLAASSARAVTIAAARTSILAQTMPYLNIPYLWGGVSPDTGLDCSGFVQLVYQRAGLSLPRVAREQFSATRHLKPREVQPGDLIFFSMHRPRARKVDHVGIYLGKGLFIHASVTNGIHVEPVSKTYYQERLVSIRRYRGF